VIPLNSAAKFGLVHSDGSSLYHTVEDILNAPSQPPIVAATATYEGEDHKSSVSKNEVLVVQGATKGAGKKFKFNRPTLLKVYSITKGMEKLLAKEVCGKFTTEPFR